MIKEINNDNYKQLLEDNNLLIIKFYADWCGPCNAYGPIFKEFASKYTDAPLFVCNIDDSKRVAAKFSVRSIPSTLVIKDGEVAAFRQGVMQFDALKSLVELYMSL
jgi:thioredoxin 1